MHGKLTCNRQIYIRTYKKTRIKYRNKLLKRPSKLKKNERKKKINSCYIHYKQTKTRKRTDFIISQNIL